MKIKTMNRIVKLVCFVLVVFASGCSPSPSPSHDLDEAYFLLVGNTTNYFEEVEIGKVGRQDNQDHHTGSVGATIDVDNPFSAKIYYNDKFFYEMVDAGMQIPIKDWARNIKISSNSDVLYVYITKQYFEAGDQIGHIVCLYKTNIHPEDGNSSLEIDLEEVKRVGNRGE